LDYLIVNDGISLFLQVLYFNVFCDLTYTTSNSSSVSSTSNSIYNYSDSQFLLSCLIVEYFCFFNYSQKYLFILSVHCPPLPAIPSNPSFVSPCSNNLFSTSTLFSPILSFQLLLLFYYDYVKSNKKSEITPVSSVVQLLNKIKSLLIECIQNFGDCISHNINILLSSIPSISDTENSLTDSVGIITNTVRNPIKSLPVTYTSNSSSNPSYHVHCLVHLIRVCIFEIVLKKLVKNNKIIKKIMNENVSHSKSAAGLNDIFDLGLLLP
jgi:hypothetical protein